MSRSNTELLALLLSCTEHPDYFDIGRKANSAGYGMGLYTKDQCLETLDTQIEHILDRVRSEGFQHAGHGCFSVVYRHPEARGVVFKLSMRTDDAYAAYAMHVRDKPNKHAPTILGIQRGRHAIVFCVQEYMALHEAQERGYVSECFSILAMYTRAEAGYKRYGSMLYPYSLLKYVRHIRTFFDGAATVDMHDANLMYDVRNKCIVVTDPVSFTKGAQHAY